MLEYRLAAQEVEYAKEHARLMQQGYVVRSYVYDESNNYRVFRTGKIGEVAVLRYFREQDIPVLHSPFRPSYERHDPRDDFVIVDCFQMRRQIEVKTRSGSYPPASHFEFGIADIKADLTYIFCQHRRIDNTVWLVGWASSELIKNKARIELPGDKNDCYTETGGVAVVKRFMLRYDDMEPMERFNEQYPLDCCVTPEDWA